MTGSMISRIRELFVRYIYADHNSSLAIRRALDDVISGITPGQRGLNVGAGLTRLHSQIENLDIVAGSNIDHIGTVEALPFGDNEFDIVITQETLEHVADPRKAIMEIARVLKSGGMLYCQLPFIIGYHPGPEDFWRFTKEGMRELLQHSGLVVIKIDVAVGGATGYYRVSVEFWSILFSLGWGPLYKMLKGLFALLLYPIKWLDFIFSMSAERDRIAGGYFLTARKS